MTPRDMLDEADSLSDEDRESAWRLAAHAAYYAAFHTTRSLLERAGFSVPDAERAHAYLYLRLWNGGHAVVREAGGNLQDLRRVRNRADYDYDRSFTRRDATGQVALAARVIEQLEDVADSPATLSRIGESMRAYERDVLRDVTWRGAE